ncbi:WD40-repeat-containing domain protein [Lineolata rhizophorae]|uniref:U three protein 7 n=1 Tax=Lineolata rhizophorae TaxID=578093 RepID=A0A6A6P9T6_9PEZI|nr:WD40-repeat-containing domain protein [Lineolata rhizophorae]
MEMDGILAAPPARRNSSTQRPIAKPTSDGVPTKPHRDRSPDAAQRLKAASDKYGRGQKAPTRNVKDKKLRGKLRETERKYREAALQALDAEILLENEPGLLEAEGELERTYRVRQDQVKNDVAVGTAKKGFTLKLNELGPYVADYSRNGKDLLLAGRKGHVTTMEWRDGKLGCELQLGETVKDAKWLHNNQYFAVAQKKYVYIYDSAGVEIHKLQKHVEVNHMEFLPYHFLLATIGNQGVLRYTDTSIGHMVAEWPTKLGAATSFAQNPYNAIVHAGHQNGTVTLWSPNSSTPLVKILAHRGPVRSLAMDREGYYMVSTGQDMKMAVWDIRMFKEVHKYFLRQPGSAVAISDRGLTSVGWGTQVTVWKDLFRKAAKDQGKQKMPYMGWGGEGYRIHDVRWCPFEDILGTTHDEGFSSLIIPGAGEPNFDALEVNPYESVKQRQEAEVSSLLNKLQPEMISLDPNFIGNIDLAADARKKEAQSDRKQEDALANIKNRGRGKNSSLRKYLRKKNSRNVIDERRLKVEALRKEQNKREQARLQQKQEQYGPALARFARKGG